jgi:hypothetical protein
VPAPLVEELRAEVILEHLHLPADRAVRHPQLGSGILVIAEADDGLEPLDRVERRQLSHGRLLLRWPRAGTVEQSCHVARRGSDHAIPGPARRQSGTKGRT